MNTLRRYCHNHPPCQHRSSAGRRFATCLGGWLILLFSHLLHLPPAEAYYTISRAPVSGYIYSRPVVLSESGNPYWVGYDSDGGVADHYGEASGAKAPEQVFVMGGASYQAYTQ